MKKIRGYGYNPEITEEFTDDAFIENLRGIALRNKAYRKVIYTSKYSQIVVMRLKPNEKISTEVHDNDQHFTVVEGSMRIILDDEDETLHMKPSLESVVPAGTIHTVVATSEGAKIITRYSPPHHPYDLVQLENEDY